MWKRKQKHKSIDDDEVKNLIFRLPGEDVNQIHIPIEGMNGTLYSWGFVPDKHQPKSIAEIMYEHLMDKKKNSQDS